MSDNAIYLDWNATAPPHADVLAAMSDAARESWGNPSSVHEHGRKARAAVEDARASVATMFGVDARDVLFTSGGTEANNIAIRSAAASRRGAIVLSRLEHPSVTRVADALADRGVTSVHYARVHSNGTIDVGDVERALQSGAAVVSVQAVNHETGVLQPIDAVSELARRYGALLHSDTVQAVGRIAPLSKGDFRILAAHKIRGPKGIGALVSRPGAALESLLLGGSQERGIRPGTVDPIACAGLRVAADRAASGPIRYAAVAPLRDELERAILSLASDARVNGEAPRAPHVSNIAFQGWNGPELVAALDLEGVSVSSGSACSAGTADPSPVITAMFDAPRARASVRFSLGDETTADEIRRAIDAIARVLRR